MGDEGLAELIGPGGPFEVAPIAGDAYARRAWVKAPPSLRALLEGTQARADRDFLVFEGERYTFGEHFAAVVGLARWLHDDQRVAKGDRVAIGMRNFPEWIISFWAIQATGAIAVPLNAWWTSNELVYALRDSGASVAVLDGERYDRLAPALADLDLRTVVARAEGPFGADVVPWEAIAADVGAADALPDVEIGPDDDATIMYTSGTTGRPKGAVSTHRNHVSVFYSTAYSAAVARLAASRAAPPSEGVPPSGAPRPYPPCSLLTYPFFHIGGLSTVCIATGFGTKAVLQRKWDVADAIGLIERERITNFAAVPKLLRELLESPLLATVDTSSLGGLGSGGAPVPPELVERIDKRFSSRVAPSNGYGLTETSGVVTTNSGRAYLGRSASVGKPYPITDVRVVAPDTGEDVDPGSVGELWFRGSSIARGYWNRPDDTAAAFTDGWFHTGDLAHRDDEGFIFIVDRLKDVIIRGGENVYCVEVEARLFEHPDVADVAVVGIAHPELGEEVVAVVVVRDGAEVTADALRDHVAQELAYFKVPAHVVFRSDPLPRNATGKVLKAELRDVVAAAAGPPAGGPEGA